MRIPSGSRRPEGEGRNIREATINRKDWKAETA